MIATFCPRFRHEARVKERTECKLPLEKDFVPLEFAVFHDSSAVMVLTYQPSRRLVDAHSQTTALLPKDI
jgi:hypothetical protein